MPGLNTVGDLIAFCLRSAGVNGIGQTPMAEDSNDGLIILQSTIAGWQRKRWLVPNLTDLSLLSTGAPSYTIGPGMDFDAPRPDRIISGFFRMTHTSPPQVDIPMTIISSREEYNRVVLKGMSTFPATVFYDSEWPLGVLYFWPAPPAGAFEMHLTVKAALPTYVQLTDPIDLPPEYMEALIYTLAVKLALQYGLDPRPAHVAAMTAAIQTIKLANAQIPELPMPVALINRRGGTSTAAGASGAFNTGWW
ncbi:MAG TPA: hypothetical protein VGI78_10675 [Acetobacteraceae bacterium]|jgi:hypothetical protein